MSVLYLECSSGISGDMTAAALLDVGADEAAVLRALGSLSVEGFEAHISRVVKSGLDVCDFDVVLDEAHENHDHDMAYLHGVDAAHLHARDCTHEYSHSHESAHEHSVNHESAHEHSRDHESNHEGSCARLHAPVDAHSLSRPHPHSHEHRDPREIRAIIDAADMTDGAKIIAHRIFDVLAEAEAKAHGVPLDEVHFHEVGAVDSIADVVAIAVALDSLDVDEVVVSELAEGKGTVRCQHGIIPVPVPAVVNIVAAYDIPLRILDVRGELVTPTGAAVVAAVRTKASLPKRFVIKRVGMGAGKRAYETPGILRAMIVEPVD